MYVIVCDMCHFVRHNKCKLFYNYYCVFFIKVTMILITIKGKKKNNKNIKF